MKNSVPFLAMLLLASTFAFGQDVIQKIDSVIRDSYQKNPNVGISVGFIQNNKEHFISYGKLGKESKTDINENSLFEIASITKILTSSLIAQAVVENKIKLNDFIDNYLPKQYNLHQNIRNKIKISDLASHQSGLPDVDFGKLIELNPQQPVSNVTEETLAAMINNCNELADYGNYRYSTISYTLLGQILEKIYGQSYDQIITSKIIKPLSMKNTLTSEFNVKNRTVAHNPEGGIQEFFNWNVTAPAGLVKSTTFDMVSYLKAVLDQETATGKAALLTEEIFYKDKKREMGLGLSIVTDEKNTIYSKSGDSMGQSSILCYNRAAGWGIIILLNQRNSIMRQALLNEIYESILK